MKTKMKMGFSMSWTVTTLLFSSLVLFSIYSNVFNLQRLGIIRDDLSSDMEVEVRITLKSSDNKEEEDEAINAYESWLLKHNLVDIQPDEKSKRFQFFKDNLRFINTENAKNHSYQLSLNKFADLNNMEFRSMYLGTAKPTLFRPLSHRYAHHEGDELPKSMDWRSRGAVTAVKDQGPYGSSWAYSTVASVEGLNSIVTGDLISLSEKHIQNCHKAGAGLVDYAFEFIIENGGVHINDQDFLINVVDNLETNLDYFLHMDEDQLYNHVQRCNLEDDRLVLQIDGYEYVYPPTEISLQKAVSYQPVSVTLLSGSRAFQFYDSGIFTGPCSGTKKFNLLAATIVGYGTENETDRDYWIVKNSWGSDWGEKGYMRLKRNWSDPFGCMIHIRAAYPTLEDQIRPNP